MVLWGPKHVCRHPNCSLLLKLHSPNPKSVFPRRPCAAHRSSSIDGTQRGTAVKRATVVYGPWRKSENGNSRRFCDMLRPIQAAPSHVSNRGIHFMSAQAGYPSIHKESILAPPRYYHIAQELAMMLLSYPVMEIFRLPQFSLNSLFYCRYQGTSTGAA